MASGQTAPSVYDLPPLEEGGVANRQGMQFQDHVAAGFCLDMFANPSLLAVWCETQDDTTLIWQTDSSVCAEFVQTKSSQLGQLWSIALLCSRDSKGVGSSVLEKSLAYDRCQELVRFRLVTTQQVNSELKPLTYGPDSMARTTVKEAEQQLVADLRKRVGDFISVKGRDCGFWAENALWDVRHSTEAVENANLLKMAKILDAERAYLAVDSQREVYSRLLNQVYDASSKRWLEYREEKRLTREGFVGWLRSALYTAAHPASCKDDTALRRKMDEASLPPSTIESACELRRYYVEEVLRPRYLNVVDRSSLHAAVVTALVKMKAQLDAGELIDSGVAFHSKCLKALDEIGSFDGIEQGSQAAFLAGCMYDVTNRCLHRFRREAR